MSANIKPAHKIINDPVYGFISIDDKLLLDVIDHPCIQRLRRIRQLGMTNLVYPGAQHTRFQHAIGAMHLIQLAIETLRNKGQHIDRFESQAAMAAMLMHDIGHGPFSHVLENSIVHSVCHEQISEILMNRMDTDFGGRLRQAIDMFDGNCKPFLHQLISSQLDTDRLDYLKRDSFFSGVAEGTVGSDRIIKMLNVCNDNLVVESKGIYSIEKFLIARRLMYWQVYLHKTVVAAEKMLRQILARAKHLAQNGRTPFAPPQLAYFLANEITAANFDNDETVHNFTLLDDTDIMSAIKTWVHDPDPVLSTLSAWFVNRKLPKIEISRTPFAAAQMEEKLAQVKKKLNLNADDCQYFVDCGSISSKTYMPGADKIHIYFSNGDVRDISEASDMLDLQALGKSDVRYYLCYPKTFEKIRM